MCEGPGAGDSWPVQGTDGGSGGNKLVLMWGRQEEFTLNKVPWNYLLSQSVFVCVFNVPLEPKPGPLSLPSRAEHLHQADASAQYLAWHCFSCT